MHFSEAQLLGWLQQYAWPFLRIGAALMTVPVFSSRQISTRIRVLLALLLSLVMAPLLPAMPVIPLWSGAWWLTLFQQLAIGVLIGFLLQLVFEAVTLAAELMSAAAGLGFAQLADPLRGAVVPVLAQLLTLFTTLTFLAMGGHLLLFEYLARSFTWMPVGSNSLGLQELGGVLQASTRLFVGGLSLALPVLMGLLLINFGLGVVSRAAPSLNLFAVGFPLTLLAVLLLLQLALPGFGERVQSLFDEAWLSIAQLLRH